MTYESIMVETRGAVTLVTLNRPHALNALNGQVLADLIAAYAAYVINAAQFVLKLRAARREREDWLHGSGGTLGLSK